MPNFSAQNYIAPLEEAFVACANQQQALKMAAYMKNKFVFFGLSSKHRRLVTNEFIGQFSKPTLPQCPQVIKHLWTLDQREFQYVALDLAVGYFKKTDAEAANFLEHLITTKSWWDTVDLLAARCAGAICSPLNKAAINLINNWNNSPNMWLNRTAILCQLHYKQNTNTELLTACILSHINSKEFFIQKAIGWALRQYAKTNPTFVIDFCQQHTLAKLSHREALKNVK